AWAAVSATTSATGSPTWRARPRASAGRGVRNAGVPSRRLRPPSVGSDPTPSAARSSPVSTASTPGGPPGGPGVDPAEAPVRVRGAHHDRVGLAGHVDVVGVAPEALDQPRVLEAPHRLADRELRRDDWLAHVGGSLTPGPARAPPRAGPSRTRAPGSAAGSGTSER